MNSARLGFAGNWIGLDWEGEPASNLVDFLFGNAIQYKTLRGSENLPPQVTFKIQSENESGNLAASNNLGNFLRGTPEQIAYLLMDQVTYQLADQTSAGMLIHAACLAKDGIAVAFPGASGSGKSTLALWLTRQGFDYLTDELVFIPLEKLDCEGLPRPVNLKNASARLFGDFALERTLHSTLVSGAKGLMVQPQNTIPKARLKTLIFPQFDKNADFSFQRLTGAQAALSITSCLVNARNLPENGFPELLRLARSLPAYSLIYPGFDSLLDVIESAIQV